MSFLHLPAVSHFKRICLRRNFYFDGFILGAVFYICTFREVVLDGFMPVTSHLFRITVKYTWIVYSDYICFINIGGGQTMA